MSYASAATPEWPADGLEFIGHCPLCKAVDRKLLHEGLEDKLFRCAPGKWTMFACAACGLAYLDPRPDRASIGMAYKTYFTHDESLDDDPLNAGQGIMQRAKQSVLKQYITLRFGRARHWRDTALGYLVYLHSRQRVAFDSAMRHLPKPGALHRLLDVGCGSGRFMAWARAAGWCCSGTEVDRVAAGIARSRGFRVFDGDLAKLAVTGKRFHAITISHVIEHVHDPEALLLHARQLLEPGGVLWIETPNLNSHGYDRFASAWQGLDPPRHLQLFNHQLLQGMLTKAGFCDIKLAPWQLDWEATFPDSLRLARLQGEAPGRHGAIRKEEVVGKHRPEKREFVTLVARTSGPCL